MTDADEGLRCDHIDVSTKACLDELGIDCPRPLLAEVVRVDGVVIPIAFESFSTLQLYILEMNPRRVRVRVGAQEDHDAIESALIHAAFGKAIH